MNEFGIFAGKPGITIGITSIDSKTEVIDAVGQQKDVTNILKATLTDASFDPHNLLFFGIKEDGKTVHVAILRTHDGQPITDAAVTLTKAQITGQFKDGFKYMSFDSAMKDGVVVASFDEGFEPDEKNGKAFGNFKEAVFTEGGKVRGAQTDTLLLIARPGNRVLVVARYQGEDVAPLTQLELPTQMRNPEFGVIGGHTLIATESGSSVIHITNVRDISRMFDTAQTPRWIPRNLDDVQIEGISLQVDDSQTVILTATTAGIRQFIPATVIWDKQGEVYTNPRLQIAHDAAIPTKEIEGWTPALLRVSVDTDTIVARDTNGGPNLLAARTTQGYAPRNARFAQMIRRASAGEYAAA